MRAHKNLNYVKLKVIRYNEILTTILLRMKSKNERAKIGKWRRYVIMQLPTFLVVAALAMSATVFVDLLVFQSCRVVLGKLRYDTCDLLHTNSSSDEAKNLQRSIQPHASDIILCKTLIEGLLPALLSLFMGPWSDKYGRKPILIAAFTGPPLMFTILSVLSNFDLNPWVYLIACTPLALLGGMCGLMLSVLCYTSDITDDENRAWYLACLEASVSAATIVGTISGPFIFTSYGYTALFAACAIVASLSAIYVTFWVPETIQSESGEKWRNPFDLNLVSELIQTCVRKRPELNRTTLWCSIIVLSFYTIVSRGDTMIEFLFVSAKLGWNAVNYSNYHVISVVLNIIGAIIGTKIFKFMGLTDTRIALTCATSVLFFFGIKALTFESWHMFVAAAFGSLSLVLLPPMYAVLSRSAPSEDVGKVFSLKTTVEAVVPLATSPLYTTVYSRLLEVYPAPIHLISCGLYLAIIVLILICDKTRSTSKVQITRL